jgi:dihydroorotate dehydrogenase
MPENRPCWLDKLLKQDGFDTVADAVGSNRSAWL